MMAVLGVQLILAIVLWSSGSDYTAFKAKEPLLAFDAAKVDQIEIGESGASSVELTKQDGKWTVPSLLGFPADEAKVSGLLTKIAGLKKGWPVASSAEAAKRFKVTDAAHERLITLKSGGKESGKLFIGTSPAFKQAHARAGTGKNIYSVAFATYDAGVRGEDWMDRSLLNIPQDQIASISIGGVTLDRKDGKFALAGLSEKEKPNETAIYRLVGALTYPAFDAVSGKGPDALAKVSHPDIEVTVKRTAGAPVTLKYKKEEGGGAYLFTSSANSFLFRASEAAIEPVVKAKREELIEAPKKADNKAESGKAESGKAENKAENVKPEDKAENVKPDNKAENVKPEDKAANVKPGNESGKGEAQTAGSGEPNQPENGNTHVATQPAAAGQAPAPNGGG